MSALRQEIGTDEILRELGALRQAIDKLKEDRRPEWYTIPQVASAWGKSVRTIQRKIAAGEIETQYRHGQRMIHRDLV